MDGRPGMAANSIASIVAVNWLSTDRKPSVMAANVRASVMATDL